MDCELGTLSQKEVLEKPWKYIGYRGFTQYCASNYDFFALRRYDRLHCRVLLNLQDNIALLEEELENLENGLSDRIARDIDNGTVRRDTNQARTALLKQIAEALRHYDDMLNHFLNLKSRPRAPSSVVKNMRVWLENNNQPIDLDEVKFLSAADLISTAPFQKSRLRYFFERSILCPTMGLFGLFTEQGETSSQEAHLDPSTVYGRDEPIDRVAAILLFIVVFGMLIAPLWILAYVQDMFNRLGVITAFTTAALGFLTSATLAKPFEILASTAGYAAVLVVFLQMGPSLGQLTNP